MSTLPPSVTFRREAGLGRMRSGRDATGSPGGESVGGVAIGGGLRVAVVGCGYWGSKHVRVLDATDGVEEVTLVDGNEDRLRGLGRNYRNAPRFSALTPALPRIDAVVVATPPSTHVAVALEAIESGKHVLVEKPLATTTSD